MQLANKHQLAKKDGKRKTESKHACPNAKSIPKRKLEKRKKKRRRRKRRRRKKARPNALRNCNKSKSLSDLFLKCVFFRTSFCATSLSLSQSVFLLLHWLPILERIKYKVAWMRFNVINGSGPAYLSELLHVYTPSSTLRSSSDTRMLKIQKYKRKTHSFRTFSCFGPHICHSLPQDLRHCSIF